MEKPNMENQTIYSHEPRDERGYLINMRVAGVMQFNGNDCRPYLNMPPLIKHVVLSLPATASEPATISYVQMVEPEQLNWNGGFGEIQYAPAAFVKTFPQLSVPEGCLAVVVSFNDTPIVTFTCHAAREHAEAMAKLFMARASSTMYGGVARYADEPAPTIKSITFTNEASDGKSS